MNIVCIIPARGGSKGLPSKNIKNFADKPLLAWSVLQAKASSKVNAGVYVSSDSADILRVAEHYGANTILRPDNLSTDTASSEAALIHAMNTIIKEKKVDYVVFLQCTSPIRLANDVDDAIDTIIQDSSDSLLSVQALTDYFVWEKKGAVANSHNFDYTNRQKRQDLPTRYLEN
ncbi:MAG: acylneuraminate cytidylyltransferase family protein, partial [Paraglaciecola sp.]|uniref:acylneuraminate cytidylyltransferase family protein n=1 Tax=Paraglaciecola sp. TaxID=1920173 RepID=UPI0032982171